MRTAPATLIWIKQPACAGLTCGFRKLARHGCSPALFRRSGRRGAGPVHRRDQLAGVARGARAREQEALDLAAPFAAQPLELLLGLDALGGRRHAEALAQPSHRADDGERRIVLVDVADERAVDLDPVER